MRIRTRAGMTRSPKICFLTPKEFYNKANPGKATPNILELRRSFTCDTTFVWNAVGVQSKWAFVPRVREYANPGLCCSTPLALNADTVPRFCCATPLALDAETVPKFCC